MTGETTELVAYGFGFVLGLLVGLAYGLTFWRDRR